tara:strand:- start:223 stop:528 length:306 start_codon:yes stop_codon:yes gene_type:complete
MMIMYQVNDLKIIKLSDLFLGDDESRIKAAVYNSSNSELITSFGAINRIITILRNNILMVDAEAEGLSDSRDLDQEIAHQQKKRYLIEAEMLTRMRWGFQP